VLLSQKLLLFVQKDKARKAAEMSQYRASHPPRKPTPYITFVQVLALQTCPVFYSADSCVIAVSFSPATM
jgi:hypothetical protein